MAAIIEDDSDRHEAIFRGRISGMSPRRLADQHGLSVETVNDIVAKRLTKIDNRYRAEALALDLEAIGLAQGRVLKEALAGDMAAVHALAKLVQLRADLLGTFAPTRVDVTVAQAATQTSTDELEAAIELLVKGPAQSH
ncbi:hypothetical protein JQ617_03365 [Bradyrhizobium sp. KB893862 SZCCT0404]|uniref:hypothetical protein n=1 Tax=Bradyrhizobium sp. KB893862 SZCCT0404 TaxID=2807672 RepID=UPI001BAB129C|nr:hypothetical protein [Bradyrhizobium sp. KB893862 SZCCT0404]MBR1172984.1 hypothetical protein [Bradyrhizobium sp. KB893862 SZCCT0404]